MLARRSRRGWVSLAGWGALSALLGGLGGLASVSLASFSTLDTTAWYLQVHFAAMLLCLLGMFGLYGALRLARSPGNRDLLALAGAVATGLAILSILALAVNPYIEGWGPILDRTWWEELLLLAAAPYGASVALALLGVSAARERSFGALLRALPLVAAVLYPASIVLNLLVNVAAGTSWVEYWPASLMLYQPFLQAVLLGCALLTAYAGGSSSTRYSRTS